MRPVPSFVLLTVLSGAMAIAQQPDASAPPPGGPHHFPGQMDSARAWGFHIGPPGIWWHNPDLVQKLTLTADQQKRMDDIFQQNKSQLMDLRSNLEKQEQLMGPMLAADQPDTNKILAQIDQTAQARAELEKATAKMLLGVRNVLTPDQWSKLQAAEQENRRNRMKFGGPGGQGNPHGGPPPSNSPPGGEGQ